MSEWISVEDHLPPYGESVAVVMSNYPGHYRVIVAFLRPVKPGKGPWRDNNSHGTITAPITHWMALPSVENLFGERKQ